MNRKTETTEQLIEALKQMAERESPVEAELRDLRLEKRRIMRLLKAEGMSYADLGRLYKPTGISRNRIMQMVKG